MFESLFLQLGFIIILAVIISGVMKLLGQPLIVGYILTGIIAGPYFLNIAGPEEAIAAFSQFGIAFLLFAVGLSLDPSRVKKVGWVSLVTGLGQVLFTSGGGFVIAWFFLGFSPVASAYIAVALTFSSTIIIVKLLSDKREMDTLHGRIAVGFLVVQDLVVALILMVLPFMVAGGSGFELEKVVLPFALLTISLPVGIFIIPPLVEKAAHTRELLFLFSIGWVVLLGLLFEFAHLSVEVGALIAGVTLASFPFSKEIKARLRPLRDFFLLFFFVWVGSQMVFSNLVEFWPAILIFSLFVLIGNPLIVICLMGAMRYSKRTSFLSGLTVAQISEFSLIFVSLGVALGHVGNDVLSLVTAVGLITILGSTYLIFHSHKIYNWLFSALSIFERKGEKVDARMIEEDQGYKIILFGCDRIGSNLLSALSEVTDSLLVVDFNPEIIEDLREAGYKAQYGDAKDPELLDDLPLEEAKMIVSTVPDFDSNSLIIQETRERNKEAIMICASYHSEDALRLYKEGASYVFMPYFLGAEHASDIISHHKFDKESYEKRGKSQVPKLKMQNKIGGGEFVAQDFF